MPDKVCSDAATSPPSQPLRPLLNGQVDAMSLACARARPHSSLPMATRVVAVVPPSLATLPDDVLLRIVSLTGVPKLQMGAAYRLGAVSTRFRRLLETHFLPSITRLTNDCLAALSLSDVVVARAALTAMFAAAPAVKELNLCAFASAVLTGDAIAALARSARTSLVKVSFAYCRVTDHVVAPLLQCPNLTFLSLFSCDGLTGSMFMEGDVQAPLQFLDLSWVHTLTREGVRAIAQVATLQELVLTGCESVNARTLRAFTVADVRRSLASISLSYCPLKNSALAELLQSTPNLRRLTLAEYSGNLWATGNFTTLGIEELRNKYPLVEILFTT